MTEQTMVRLVKAAKDVVESISFDDNGALIGGKWMGGHGGLLSDDTRKKAGELRRAIHAAESEQTRAKEQG